jgi:hypothetical protein
MMSGMPLETFRAFNKFWNKFYYKVASCWLYLLIHTTMHGSMNIKFTLTAVGGRLMLRRMLSVVLLDSVVVACLIGFDPDCEIL